MALAVRFRRWEGIALILLVLLMIYQQPELRQWLTLDQLKASRDILVQLYESDPWRTALIFFGVYVLVAALSLPGATILTLAGGAIFGLGVGLLLVSFASSIGALLAFLLSRWLLRDIVRARFERPLALINAGLAGDGVTYLLMLRLIPVFPFWLVNLLMGLTAISPRQFYITSQAGMLAGTAIYVNAGTRLGGIRELTDILSPALLGSLLLLGMFPLLVRWAIRRFQRWKLYARWPRPARFDRNLVVIGAGAGGLVSALIGATVKARVTLIESHRMGGDCLNYGCVPSKTLIRSARAAKELRNAGSLGISGVTGSVDFAAVMRRVQEVIRTIEPHDSTERYTGLGVEVMQGHAHIVSPWSVEVTLADGQTETITTRNIIIATGASPVVPSIPGLKEAGFLTSETVWDLTELPGRLVVLGGGPIGCELAQSFARLGSEVTQVELASRILTREELEVSDLVAASLRADGVRILTGHQAVRVEVVEGERQLVVSGGDQLLTVPFDHLLCALGRIPRVTGYGLEELGIPLTARGTVETDAYLRTIYPNIYAVGDVAGPFQFTHTAAHQAWYAAVNALFGRFRRFKADYSVIPWVTFTDPEVARVGLSEAEAREKGVPFEVSRYETADLDRAIVDGSAPGFIKVLTVPGKDRILGVTIVGEHAGELLSEYVLAMKHGLGLNRILGTIHSYPTFSEANKYVAGEWKRAHAPRRLLPWLERFHTWERT
ncbi:MAG: FAD-dependent oxidoreductase [Gemmatimonadota bacterium]|jgi:pyruvate/2-oxoglutarate dehydrogenase complex dihydrolipoamide dehydrogenase (E3) component/uncharacterized membrane protein YdjX (TVP38/TMEM64 family)|nr:FAD-dependent oxidoreductase [Gemmatimonadota bacterium]